MFIYLKRLWVGSFVGRDGLFVGYLIMKALKFFNEDLFAVW